MNQISFNIIVKNRYFYLILNANYNLVYLTILPQLPQKMEILQMRNMLVVQKYYAKHFSLVLSCTLKQKALKMCNLTAIARSKNSGSILPHVFSNIVSNATSLSYFFMKERDNLIQVHISWSRFRIYTCTVIKFALSRRVAAPWGITFPRSMYFT